MTDRDKRSALNLAIKLMQKRIGVIAFNANLEEVYGADLPVTRSASKEREQLKKAIGVLTEIEKGVCNVSRPTIIKNEPDEVSSETMDILDYISEANY